MAQFYNPYQNRTTVQQPQATPSAVPGLNASGKNANAGGDFGYLSHMNQIGGTQWGTGASFQGAARVAGLNALKSAMSNANPEDYAGMDEMRNYYRGELANLPSQQNAGRSALDSQMQYGLKNMLSQYKGANAGRGTLGSRQYAGAQGDIVSRANQDYISGLIKARSDALDQAGKINTGLGDLQGRNLDERQFQMSQGQSLADLIAKYLAMDMGRESQVDVETQSDFDKERGNIRGVVGAIFGGAAGASKGGGGRTGKAGA